ncbi:MAG: TldD/PmbA family protein, partial [Thermoflexia bacterium]
MLGETAIREIVERVLALSRAEETEVLFFGLEERLTRFANNTIHQNVAAADAAVVVRAVVGSPPR